jgi:hypothetical protein
MCRGIIMATVTFLSWSVITTCAHAQDPITVKATSYAFEVGKEYIYTHTFRQVDVTQRAHYHGDSYQVNRTISICAYEVDSSGNMQLMFTVSDESIEPIETMDASSLEDGTRVGWEQKFRALVSPSGNVRDGEILVMCQHTRELLEHARRSGSSESYQRISDSAAVRYFTSQTLPILPTFTSRHSDVTDLHTLNGAAFHWTNERKWQVESVLSDTVDAHGDPAVRIDTRAENGNATVSEEQRPGFPPIVYRDFGFRVILRANGCLESWQKRTTMEIRTKGGPQITTYEQTGQLVDIRACQQAEH